ncbi:MAG: hypothetical protein A2169_02745 [Deltaproteobacteria bacterium RBG_13_47_9]|nr:MAG: hypothetical protein A2169_02745 [Deltaproteobacteria bacterium RBG_13_47_9]
MKKGYLILLLLLVSAALIFGGGAKPTPKEVIKLKVSHMWPAGSRWETDVLGPALEDMKKATKGAIGYTFYPVGTLNAPADAYDATARGICDVTFITTTFNPGRFPLTDIFGLPLNWPKSALQPIVGKPVFDQFLYKEYPDVKPLAILPTSFFYLYTTKKVRTLEDMKGLKIRSAGGIGTNVIKALGAEAVFMALPDAYLAMQTGVVDGLITGSDAGVSFKLQEVTKWGVIHNLGSIPIGLLMNKNTWAKIPDQYKDAVAKIGWGEGFYHTKMIDDTRKNDIQTMTAGGANAYYLPPEEVARWEAVLKPMLRNWIADLEAKGLPAKAVAAAYKQSCLANGVPWPYD